MAKQTFSKMKPTTMIILGAVLVLVLPFSLLVYFTTANSALLVISMLGVVTFPVGAVMIVVGFMVRNKNSRE